MVVDTSALVAIVLGESDAEIYLSVLIEAIGSVFVSAASIVEATIVVESRQGIEATRDLELLLARTGAVVEPVSAVQAAMAAAAWRRFGLGRHGAALNFGDCFSYALARELDQALLFKGQDFAQTDIRSAVAI